jgi:hypothetical protein
MEKNNDFRVYKVCDWDKRKKCDSLYIKKCNVFAKKLHKVLEVVEKYDDEKLKKEIRKILKDI